MDGLAPRVRQVVETAIDVADLARSIEFYTTVIGLERQFSDGRFCAFTAGPGQVFLVFRRSDSQVGVHIPGGYIPPHNASGSQHYAFAISACDFENWKERLTGAGVAIEGVVDWPLGGRSLYFRDPDGHLGELVTPGIWLNY